MTANAIQIDTVAQLLIEKAIIIEGFVLLFPA